MKIIALLLSDVNFLFLMKEQKDFIDQLISDWRLERPDLEVEAMQVVGRIIKLGKVFEKRASNSLREIGIYYTDLDVLATLRRSGFPYELSPKQLMESVLITSGAMTALLNRLTKLELIHRIPDKNDGRIILAGLTQKGKELIDKAIEIRFEEAQKSIDILSDQEHYELSGLLKKMLVSLDD